MKSWLKMTRPLTLIAAVAVVFGACDEQIDSGVACPALCPNLPSAVRDTEFFAVELDTSIAGFPEIGGEVRLFLAQLGDTLQTLGVVRYDSLPGTYRHTNSAVDSVITSVDTGAYIRLSVVDADTLGASVMVEAFDVDQGGPDDVDPNEAASAFTPDRLLGSRVFAASELKDTIKVPIDPARLLALIQAPVPGNRLRVGLRASNPSGGSSRLSVRTTNGGANPTLVFRPAIGDTTVPRITHAPRSLSPAEVFVDNNLADYLIVVKAAPPPLPTVFRIGGLPAQRAYLRFNIPTRIIDSSSVVRASLLLTRRPAPLSVDSRDSLAIQQLGIVASTSITDLARALQLATQIRQGLVDSVQVIPGDSGVVSFEMIDLVRTWRGTSPEKTPRALALRSTVEGGSGQFADFFSLEAPASVRPRLRLTYVPRAPQGLP